MSLESSKSTIYGIKLLSLRYLSIIPLSEKLKLNE